MKEASLRGNIPYYKSFDSNDHVIRTRTKDERMQTVKPMSQIEYIQHYTVLDDRILEGELGSAEYYHENLKNNLKYCPSKG